MPDQDPVHRIEAKKKIRIMRNVLFAGLLLTLIKFVAYHFTSSNAVLTDALESIINIVAAAFGLFSLVYSARPKDENHPYGHGKIEFLAIGFEGALIFFAGCGMIVTAIYAFLKPHELSHLDIGLYLVGATAVVNFFIGRYLIGMGKKMHSHTLVADGQHLLSDTYSSLILIAGLVIMLITGKHLIDTFLTFGLGVYILIVGYKLLRNSLAGLMDETDFNIVKQVIEALNKERKAQWIDIHNLRVVRYGYHLHIDAHLTLPWYDLLRVSHDEVKSLEKIINFHFGNRVEFFIHTDPCLPDACSICTISNCNVREFPFKQKMDWNMELLMKNLPHKM